MHSSKHRFTLEIRGGGSTDLLHGHFQIEFWCKVEQDDLCTFTHGRVWVLECFNQDWQAHVCPLIQDDQAESGNNFRTVRLIRVGKRSFQERDGGLTDTAQDIDRSARPFRFLRILHHCFQCRNSTGSIGPKKCKTPFCNIRTPGGSAFTKPLPHRPVERSAKGLSPRGRFVVNPFQQIRQRIGANVSHCGSCYCFVAIGIGTVHPVLIRIEPFGQTTAQVFRFVLLVQHCIRDHPADDSEQNDGDTLSAFREHNRMMEVLRD